MRPSFAQAWAFADGRVGEVVSGKVKATVIIGSVFRFSSGLTGTSNVTPFASFSACLHLHDSADRLRLIAEMVKFHGGTVFRETHGGW